VLDDARRLDDEARQLRAEREVGSYQLNERGYIACTFNDLKLTGLPCEQARNLLAFHAWRPSTGISFSLVFRRRRLHTTRRGKS
jgi:hypothetical protein